jgi:hypothetical protein
MNSNVIKIFENTCGDNRYQYVNREPTKEIGYQKGCLKT